MILLCVDAFNPFVLGVERRFGMYACGNSLSKVLDAVMSSLDIVHSNWLSVVVAYVAVSNALVDGESEISTAQEPNWNVIAVYRFQTM